jgi:hypothetical protein
MKAVGLAAAIAMTLVPMTVARAALLVDAAVPADSAIPATVNSDRACVVEKAPPVAVPGSRASARSKKRRPRHPASGRPAHIKRSTRRIHGGHRPPAARAGGTIAPAAYRISCDELVPDHFSITPLATDLANAMMAGKEMDQIREQKLMRLKRRRGQAGFGFPPVVSAAPEPATWLTMVIGLGLVGATIRASKGRQRPAAEA